MIEILQGRSEAYSSWSEKIVNDCNHGVRSKERYARAKFVDREEDGRECRTGVGFE
jgi:hypothetical protein